MPATINQVPATQSEYACPVGYELAVAEYGVDSTIYETGERRPALDINEFQSGGKIYRYDKAPSQDTSRICVQQKIAATD